MIDDGREMRKALRALRNIEEDICEALPMLSRLKGAELANNEEIAEDIQTAIDHVDAARKHLVNAQGMLLQIKTECYED